MDTPNEVVNVNAFPEVDKVPDGKKIMFVDSEDNSGGTIQFEKLRNQIASDATDPIARAQIQNLAKLPEGSTTGDAELSDIRVGADGTQYPNAGAAVREQIKSARKNADEAIASLKEDKIDKPATDDDGKIPRAKEGGVEWVEVGQPTDDQTDSAVTKWLDKHPEATTTVQDGAIGETKINEDFLLIIKKDYVTPEMFGAIGNGIDDDSIPIQKAVNSQKKVMFISDYCIKKYISINNKTTIDGNGHTIMVDSSDVFNIDNGDKIIIKNLKIVNSRQKYDGTNRHAIKIVNGNGCTFENLNISGFYGENTNFACIDLKGYTANNTIRNCEIYNCGCGILMYGENVNYNTIDNCYIHDAEYSPIMIKRKASHNKVLHCHCANGKESNISVNADYCIISECYSENSKLAGIALGHDDENEEAKNCIVSNNILINNVLTGARQDNSTICNNKIFNGSIGVSGNNIVVANNYIYGGGATGAIQIGNPNVYCKNIKVLNNSIINCIREGIRFVNVQFFMADGNYILDCNYKKTADYWAMASAIVVSYGTSQTSPNGNIKNNILINEKGHATYGIVGDAERIKNNYIDGNTVNGFEEAIKFAGTNFGTNLVDNELVTINKTG